MLSLTLPPLVRLLVMTAPLCLLFSACMPITPELPQTEPAAEATALPAPEGAAPALEGVTWQLTEYRGQGNEMTTPAAPATLLFQEGRSGGNSGCNNFMAQYTVDGQQLTIKQGAGTMRACAEPSMAQERFFFANLGKITSYEMTGAQLHLLDDTGQTLLAFTAQADTGAVSQAGSVLTGTVTYRQRIALPAGSVVAVQLQDVSRADAPASVLATQTITTTGENVPIPFTLPYDPAQIDARLTYALRVRITSNGQLRWINTEQYAVLTNGAPTSGVQVVVQPAR